MKCWQCGKDLSLLPNEKVTFRASCDFCLADLHCCKNCRHYAPGRANDCMIPGTDFVSDRSKNNHCEDFSIRGEYTSPSKKEDALKRFNDLFK